MQRSLLMFQESLKSEHTRKQYQYYLDKFLEFCKITDYDALLKLPTDQLQIMLEDYTLTLKGKVSPNTLPTMIFGIKSFFDSNDVELRWRKIKKLFPEKKQMTGRQAWSTKEIQLMLSVKPDLRARSLILFLASSGIRIGALPDLKLKHLSQIEICKVVTVYAGTKDEYTTFLTPEASEALEQYFTKRKADGEYFEQNTPVFRSAYKVIGEKVTPESRSSLQEIVRRIIIKAGLRTRNPGKYQRYQTQIDNGFRKHFNEVLKTTEGVNPHYAEKMLGHSMTIALDNHYLNADLDKLFVEYKKAIQNLTIDDAQRQNIQIQKLKAENESKSKLELMVKEHSDQILGLRHLLGYFARSMKESTISDVRDMGILLDGLSNNPPEFKPISSISELT